MKYINKGYQEAKQALEQVESGITDSEGECLYNLARNSYSDQAIVEIGSWKGGSTIWLAKGSEAGGRAKVYAIDPHKGTAESSPHGETNTEIIFRQNIKRAGVDHIVNPLIMKSEEAITVWTQAISLLWIDGSHEYEDVLKDFTLYEPYLQPGGIVAFHDSWTFLGPRRIIRRYILKSNLFSDVGITGRIVFATKKQSTFWDKGIKFRLLLLSYAAELVDFLTRPKGLIQLRRFLYKSGGAIKSIVGKG